MRLSISDDDLCSTCENLCYEPGDLSTCFEQQIDGWPAIFDENGYARKCDRYKKQPIEDWNWGDNRRRRDDQSHCRR